MLKVQGKLSQQKGAALVTAIFTLLIATVIGIAVYYAAIISFTVAVNERNNTEAFYLADAGVNHAVALIGKARKSQYSAILKAGDNTPNTGDELSVPPSIGLWTSAQSIPTGNANSGGVTNFGAGGTGRYWVAVKNDTAAGETPSIDLNGILIITSTGVGRDGATATVEVTIQDNSENYPAVLINGKVKVSGNVNVTGTNGILHANDTLIIEGNPCADQYFSSSADIINPGKLKGKGCIGIGNNQSYQPIIPPPIYNIPNDFYSKSDFILGAKGQKAGKVFDSSGNLVHNTATTNNKWVNNGATWTWNPLSMTWAYSGNKILNATYYSEGNMEVSGNFGTSSLPSLVTFIAEGYLDVSGKLFMVPEYSNFALLAGTDLKISGKLSTDGTSELGINGIVYTHHQINLSGTPLIEGVVVAANQDDTNSPGCGCNYVPLDGGYMHLSGNATIVNNGTSLGGGTKLLNWREIRY